MQLASSQGEDLAVDPVKPGLVHEREEVQAEPDEKGAGQQERLCRLVEQLAWLGQSWMVEPLETGGEEACDFPSDAQLCVKCSTKAVIKMDGCMTCLNCGDSKCG